MIFRTHQSNLYHSFLFFGVALFPCHGFLHLGRKHGIGITPTSHNNKSIIHHNHHQRFAWYSALYTTTDDIDSTTPPPPPPTNERPTAILICPAQFCVPAVYEDFLSTLKSKSLSSTKISKTISSASCVADLPRTEWIKVARQLPTSDFFNANLNNAKTLQWYFDAMEKSLADIYASEGDSVEICIIGHSIGGWVARSYLGGLSQSSTAVYRLTMENCKSLITLGTPHSSPSSALVDQTRGLLRAVEETESCSAMGLANRGIQTTCVGSTAVKGNILTTNLEEIVATTSYIPLVSDWKKVLFGSSSNNSTTSSDGGVRGDGIIPLDLAFMDSPPANRVELERCTITGNDVRHAHVLPTPYNLWDPYAPSISLPESFCWYGSEGVIDLWIEYI